MQECVRVPPVLAELDAQGGFAFLLAMPEEIVERFGIPNDSFVQCRETDCHVLSRWRMRSIEHKRVVNRPSTTNGLRIARPRAAASSGTGGRRSRPRGAA